MRKIYIVPNFVTTLGMLCGFYSIISSFAYDFERASWAIVLAIVFDGLDGRIARMTNATSQFGVEYDSLADLVSFGLAPAVLAYTWGLEPFGRLGWLAAFLFVACGALRLARFNVTTKVLPKAYFQGMPSPVAATMVATFVIFNSVTGWPSFIGDSEAKGFLLGLVLLNSSLMVSSLAFPSFKEWNWQKKVTFGYLMVGVLGIVLLIARPEHSAFLLLMAYTVSSLIWNAVRAIRRRVRLRYLERERALRASNK